LPDITVDTQHSWRGSFDLFERHGADVILFGSSESYRSLIPAVLAESLGGGTERIKVLSCQTPGMLVDTVETTRLRSQLKDSQELAKKRNGLFGAIAFGALTRDHRLLRPSARENLSRLRAFQHQGCTSSSFRKLFRR
jgi:hypothetical protein